MHSKPLLESKNAGMAHLLHLKAVVVAIQNNVSGLQMHTEDDVLPYASLPNLAVGDVSVEDSQVHVNVNPVVTINSDAIDIGNAKANHTQQLQP